MPPIFSSTPVRFTSVLVCSVVMVGSLLIVSVAGVRVLGIGVIASGIAAGGGVDHQGGSVDLPVDLEVQVQQVPAIGGGGGLEDDLRPRDLTSRRSVPVRVDM